VFLDIETEPVNIDIGQIKLKPVDSKPPLYVDETIEIKQDWFEEVKNRDQLSYLVDRINYYSQQINIDRLRLISNGQQP
jgi:hypothetical protein